MRKLFGVKFRNYRLVFRIAEESGMIIERFLYVGSSKLRDYFQEIGTHEVTSVYEKNRTGTSADIAYGRKARQR